MIGQFVLGYLHHRMYKKTQTTTKLAPIHVWLGRAVILGGIVDGFLGFPLASNSKYNFALLACVLFVVIAVGPFAFWRFRRNIRKKNALADESTGYQAQPWVSTNRPDPSHDINLHQMNYQR